ncbi:hypothetical protein CHS0354_020185 [Potamilus streckersoni]|uniref:Kinase n=1 Tax=Potamilus streckersoni TaxID=2493646 RepID=A0AAE0SKI4_9BIVA|nr:hypothetical protein CHS0354_020185 [Potamilus streckersoni]
MPNKYVWKYAYKTNVKDMDRDQSELLTSSEMEAGMTDEGVTVFEDMQDDLKYSKDIRGRTESLSDSIPEYLELPRRSSGRSKSLRVIEQKNISPSSYSCEELHSSLSSQSSVSAGSNDTNADSAVDFAMSPTSEDDFIPSESGRAEHISVEEMVQIQNWVRTGQNGLCVDDEQAEEKGEILYNELDYSKFRLPPAVIISDFSCPYTEDKVFRFVQGQDLSTDFMRSLSLDSETETNYNSLGIHRTFSDSSICSTESSLSISNQSDQDASMDLQDGSLDFLPEVPKKPSSWIKVRNIVKSTAFPQHLRKLLYPWIQLAGHRGNFLLGEKGVILKKYDQREQLAYSKLMKDILRPYVPEYRGDTLQNNERYLQLQDLLCEFDEPSVMDIKMGVRSYLEEELIKARQKPTLRKDMYQKMLEVDPKAPTPEEHTKGAITKPRYMRWRDEISSSVELGFRIEGIRKSDGVSGKNLKKMKGHQSVMGNIQNFVEEDVSIMVKYLQRLKALQATLEVSPFFQTHEIIGSSLLFVHNKRGQASVWMIDFGKSEPLPENIFITHCREWVEGNHEDGYLIGIKNLIFVFETLLGYTNNEDMKSEPDFENVEPVSTIKSIDGSDSVLTDRTGLIASSSSELPSSLCLSSKVDGFASSEVDADISGQTRQDSANTSQARKMLGQVDVSVHIPDVTETTKL